MPKAIVTITVLTTVFTIVGIGAVGYYERQNRPMEWQQGDLDVACAPAEDGRFFCKMTYHAECPEFHMQHQNEIILVCNRNPLDKVTDR